MAYSDIGKPVSTPEQGRLIPFPSMGQSDDEPIEIQIEGEEEEPPALTITIQDFDGNLAEHLPEERLRAIGLDLCQAIEEDTLGRKKWYDVYSKSLKYIGLEEDEERSRPWKGAANVSHPMMLEAIVRFQSRALVKLYPANGPAIVGVKNADLNPQIQILMEKAQRAFNDRVQCCMKETQAESDRLLYSLAEIGYALKKVYFDRRLNRTVTQLVRAENFLIPYGYDNLETCPRFTQIVPRTRSEVDSLIRKGIYTQNVIQDGISGQTDVEQAKSKLTGHDPSITINDTVQMYECYVDLDIEEDDHKDPSGDLSPYVVTIEKDTCTVLSIRRNWQDGSEVRKKRIIFVPYIYVPGDGSYGYGIVHLVGQLAIAATKILRQLIDAGTLANIPALLRSRDAGMTSQDPVAPGELREVEIDAENLAKAFFPLPFKEPSQVLFSLLELLIAEGKTFSSTADLDISASSQNAPVGTTLALLERQLEVANAVQKRMHTSFGHELNMICCTMQEFEKDVYDSIFGDLEQAVGQGNVVLVPAGDPTSSTLSQRVITLQAVAQQAIQAPQVYDMAALHRSMAIAMGITDVESIIPDKSQIPPMSPVEENMAILNSQPVKAYPQQDHASHITCVQSLITDPLYHQMLANNPQAPQILAAAQAHLLEHVAFQYRQQIEQQLGVQLPPMGQPQPPQIDSVLSQLTAQAAQRVAQMHASQASQMAAQQQQADPAYQLEKAEIQRKSTKDSLDHQAKMSKLQQDKEAHQQKTNVEILRIATSDKQASEAQKQQLLAETLKDDRERHGMAVDLGTQMMNHNLDSANSAADIGSRLLDHKEHAESLESQENQHAAQLEAQKEAAKNRPSPSE